MTTNQYHHGLSESQVEQSREKHGSNTLTPPKKVSLWALFIEKFKDPIILILLVALVLSVAIAFYHFFVEGSGLDIFLEPCGILLAVLLATVVGFVFETSANKKFELLNKVNDQAAVKVYRNGVVCEVAKSDIVVGDIIILETGDEIPADATLLEAVSLQVNESTLTGEPITKKTIDPAQFSAESTYPSNQVLRGTSVVEGHAVAKVTTVGDATQYGKVYEGAQIDNSVVTPLNKQLNRLADLITKASYAIATLIIIGRTAQYFHALDLFNWVDFLGFLLNTVMIAVTIIVVAVPEGLPMSVTLSLALSMKRMLKSNNLVRKMHACETMGATTVICTDKTGTLTQNQMKIDNTNFYGLEGQELSGNAISALITDSLAINSTAHLNCENPQKSVVLGNPTEGALLLWLEENGVDYNTIREQSEIVEQIPFSTERKYMATVVKSKAVGRSVLYVKGAPEIVLAMSSKVLTKNGEEPKEGFVEKINSQLLENQSRAMRTLGFAYLEVYDANTSYIKDGKLDGVELIFLGVTAISDPIRVDVPTAIKECVNGGISVKIVTGDTPATAKEIGRQIGLWSENEDENSHITGVDFASLSDKELLARVSELKIISRARPMDKQRLVQLLQQNGEVVAVTGDGTNDAPALNAAQVGLSMGDGTSVAKEASDITILDNSFSSISKAVMWGRSLYQNIQRFILFQMTINVAACLIVLIGAFLGTESPLTVTQMLWVNLIMDTFAALALASLPPNEAVMKVPPRDGKAHIISKEMARRIVGVGVVFVLFLLSLVQYFKHCEVTSLLEFNFEQYCSSLFDFSSVNGGLSGYELSLFFTIFVLLQFWNMFNAKAFMSGKSALSNISHCGSFLLTALIILVGQWLIVTFGGEMFSVTPLKNVDWLIIIGFTSLVLIIGEMARLLTVAKKR